MIVRLTDAEWAALCSAVAGAESSWAEQAGPGDGGYFKRQSKALDRAFQKVSLVLRPPNRVGIYSPPAEERGR